MNKYRIIILLLAGVVVYQLCRDFRTVKSETSEIDLPTHIEKPLNPTDSLLCIQIAPIVIDTTRTNKYSPSGSKTGLWVENSGNGYNLVYYKDGEINGPSFFYEKRRNGVGQGDYYLFSFAVTIEGKPTGSYIMFNENGLTSFLETGIDENTDFRNARTGYVKDFTFDYQSYVMNYDEYGQLKGEGWMVMTEDFELENADVGKWKYYDKDGRMTIVDHENLEDVVNYQRQLRESKKRSR